jgi:ribose transport system substrate-binding protein
VAPYLQEPTGNGITTPLTKKPPTGKLIAAVECNLPVCAAGLSAAGQAAAALGWKFKPLVSTGTPENVVQQINAALALHPDGIILNGFQDAVTETALKHALAEHVPVVNSGVPDTASPPIITEVTHTPVFNRDGQILGNFIVSDSKGDAHVAMFNMPVFPILTSLSNTLQKTITSDCSACSVKIINEELTDVGTTLPAAVVSTVQANPDINYVAFADGNFASGVAAALKGAGLSSKVKIVGQNASAPNLANILNGTEYAWTAYPVAWISWADIDALARHFVGDPQITDPLASPTILQTKANTTNATAWDPPNYQAAFKALWHVS